MSHYRAIYLQHRCGDRGPFCTERVPFRYRSHSDSVTKAGPIRSYWQVKWGGRWRWIMVPGRGPAYVVIDRQRVSVTFEMAVAA